jgi:hypothetical protein
MASQQATPDVIPGRHSQKMLELGGIVFYFQHVPGEHHLFVDAKIGIKEREKNYETAKAQDTHFHPEVLPIEKAFFIGKIQDEEPYKQEKINSVISAAESLKDKEKADPCKVAVRGIVEKSMKKKKTKGNPAKIKEFQMADMRRPEGTKSENDPGDNGGCLVSAQVQHKKIHAESAEDV